MGRQTGRQAHRQTGRWWNANAQTDKLTLEGKRVDRQVDTGRLTGRQTGRPWKANGQTDRQTLEGYAETDR